MKKMQKRKLVTGIVAILLTASAGLAQAATLTQNITLGGTVSPPPVGCSIISVPTLTINEETADATIVPAIYRSLGFQCDVANTPFTLSSPEAWTAITIGGQPAGGVLLRHGAGTDFFNAPYNSTTNGANIPNYIAVQVRLGGATANSPLNSAVHVGAVSGTLPLVLSY